MYIHVNEQKRDLKKTEYTPVAYPGYQRRGCLRSGPIRKVGGGGNSTSGPIYEKREGDSPLQVRYTKSGGGGGGGGNSPIPLFGTLCLAHRKYFIVINKRLQF